MQSITKEYLLDIIEKKMTVTIHLHRKQNPHSLNMALYAKATVTEIDHFISSIPYFDTSLKNFLTNTTEQQTIISQAWETEFVKKCELWLGSYEWMYGKPGVFNNENAPSSPKIHLGLPY